MKDDRPFGSTRTSPRVCKPAEWRFIGCAFCAARVGIHPPAGDAILIAHEDPACEGWEALATQAASFGELLEHGTRPVAGGPVGQA